MTGVSVRRSPARPPRLRRIAILVLCLFALPALVSACATLPSSSSPQAIGPVPRDASTPSVPLPTPGREPDLLVRDFLKASAEPAGRHQAARQYLTTSASAKWNDSASASIVDKIDVFFESRTSDTAKLLVSAAKVGELSPDGVFKADDGTLEARITMVRTNGEWRIDELPSGVIIDRSQFMVVYHRESLYFLNPSGTKVVPDPRWIAASKAQLASQLITMLMAGPKQPLQRAVRTEFPPGVHLRSTLTKVDGRDSDVGIGLGGVRMDFQGIGDLDLQHRRLLAAQVVWTLASAGISGPYVILDDGAPLDRQHPDGWNTQDVAATDPNVSIAGDVGLHAISGGALVSVTDSGLVPVPGQLGVPEHLLSAALSRDAKQVAAVRAVDDPTPERGQELIVGPYGGSPAPAASGRNITRPTWSAPDGAVWAAVNGDSVVRVVRNPSSGDIATGDVDIDEVKALGGPVTALRLSRDGVRAALIVGGRVYVAYVVRDDAGRYSLVNPRAIAFSIGNSAVSLDWSGSNEIFVTRSGSDNPIEKVSLDGSSVQALPERNLSPPVTTIEATPSEKLVVDSRGVMRLDTSSDEGQYWREVPGLMGTKAIPVLPG